MAETYSSQYTNAYLSRPPGHNYAYGARIRYLAFDYTQVLAGAASDTILLGKLPAQSTVLMLESAFWFASFTATATIDIGWAAYTDVDGVAVAADADGLIDGVLLTTASTWSGGMLLTATPDDSNPIVPRKVFNNRDDVTIYATILIAAPGVAATLSGYFSYVTP
jgi:hypothetical protein